ncbi:MAG: hypothetical protein L0H73_17665, partial [Nitrococcus sp.]|nr:hypothetical protein [Nitrococcus sp.]
AWAARRQRQGASQKAKKGLGGHDQVLQAHSHGDNEAKHGKQRRRKKTKPADIGSMMAGNYGGRVMQREQDVVVAGRVINSVRVNRVSSDPRRFWRRLRQARGIIEHVEYGDVRLDPQLDRLDARERGEITRTVSELRRLVQMSDGDPGPDAA